ncbi:MAG: ABC transporter transmembrane domain-containing protein, partial [Fusobacteriaceae bacterium]
MIKKFISYYKPYKKLFFLDLLAATAIAVCDLAYPMMTRSLVNRFIPEKEYRAIIVFAFLLLTIYFIKMACNYFMTYWGHVVGVRMQGDMRRDLFSRLQNFPVKYFDNNGT